MKTTDEHLIQWINGDVQHTFTGYWELHVPAPWIFWKHQGFLIHGLAVDAAAYWQINEARLLVYPEDGESINTYITQLNLHTPADFYFRIVTPGGELQVIHCTAANDSSDTIMQYKGSFRNSSFLPVENALEMQFEKGSLYASEQFTRTGSWQVNLHTSQVIFSPNVYRLHDVIPGSLPPRPEMFHRFIHPEEKQLVEKIIQQAFSLHVPLHLEYRIITDSDETRFMKLLSKVVRNEKGQDLLIGSLQDITDSKQNESQAKEAQEELGINRQVIAEIEQTAQAGYCLLQLQIRKLFCSDAFCRLFGLRLAGTDPSYESLLTCVHPEEKELFLEYFETAFDKHLFPPLHLRVFRADGKLRHIRMAGRVLKNAGKEPVMIISAKDVTQEQLGAQQTTELTERNSLLEQIVSYMEAAMCAAHFSLNPESKQVSFSPQFYQLHGLKTHTGSGDFGSFEKLIYPDDLKEVKNRWDNAIAGRQPVQIVYRIIKPDGQLRWFRLEIKTAYAGRRPPYLLGLILDCTEETLLQQKLEGQNRFVELLSRCMQEQLLLTDRSYNVLYCNNQFEKEQQLRLPVIKGANMFDVLPMLKHPTVTTAFNQVLSGKTFHLPRFQSPVSGKVREIFVLPVKNAEDKTEGILCLIRDLSSEQHAGQAVKIPYFVEDFKELF